MSTETADAYGRTAPRLVTAVLRYHDGPGLEQLAAEAWAFDLTYYFTRGVGEAPQVEYEDGVYTMTGLMQTTHPGDHGPVVDFGGGDMPLDWIMSDERQKVLRGLCGGRLVYFDGRDHGCAPDDRGAAENAL